MLWHAMMIMRRIVLWIIIDNVIMMTSLLCAVQVYSGAGFDAVLVDGALLLLYLL